MPCAPRADPSPSRLAVRPIEIPAEDRNRTSPFPYGGARFEFRAVGSSQNVSLVNTVLATLTADGFKTISDRVEKGEQPLAVARELLKKHFRVVFNGNGYDKSWPAEADKRGIWQIKSGVEALKRFTQPKNVELFATHGVFTAAECAARQECLLNHYVGTVECEALTFADMVAQHVVPSLKAAELPDQVAAVTAAAKKVADGAHALHAAADTAAKAAAARVLRLETMVEARKVVDAAEGLCPAKFWTLATYQARDASSRREDLAPSHASRLRRSCCSSTRRTTAGARRAQPRDEVRCGSGRGRRAPLLFIRRSLRAARVHVPTQRAGPSRRGSGGAGIPPHGPPHARGRGGERYPVVREARGARALTAT